MITRILLVLLALALLSALLYFQQPESGSTESTAAQTATHEPGFVAIGAELIETGDDGRPLYRLDATRITQPVPEGTIYLTAPILHYQPPGGNAWVLTAQRGQLPQSAHTADLSGSVQAQGKPTGSAELMRLETDTLHVDMQQQLATTAAVVRMHWAGSQLRGRGMSADLSGVRADPKNGGLSLYHDVSGVLVH